MFSEPDDPAVRERMRDAFASATDRLECTPATGAAQAWGHNGRTLGADVTTATGRAWLRLLEAPEGRDGGKLWTGNQAAATHLPDQVPRPVLLHTREWTGAGHAYRAELSTYVTAPVCSTTPDLSERLDLPDAWWARLRQAIDAVAATAADRPPVISQDYVHRTIPRYLGDVSTDTTVHRWTLAHGDLHWANLTGPDLVILDWEGFGSAPHGFDAAHLHAYTLPVPGLAASVRTTFTDVLETPDGRLAEFTVAAMILQAADRDPTHARLAPHVKHHIQRLLTAARRL